MSALALKLLMIGDSGVGKSCLLLRYCDDKYKDVMTATMGIDFRVKDLHVLGAAVKLQIWDTAGQERYRTITASYYRGAHAIVFVYDVADRKSFNNIVDWIQDIDRRTYNVVPPPKRILVANKCDLIQDGQRVVSTEEGQAFASDHDFPFLEASARDNMNVDLIFYTVAENVVRDLYSVPSTSPADSCIDSSSSNKQSCTC